jgi:hypothetical protein
MSEVIIAKEHERCVKECKSLSEICMGEKREKGAHVWEKR